MSTTWKERHTEAMMRPMGSEVAIVALMNAVETYVTVAERDYGTGEWRDYVLGEGIGDILSGFRVLLNGDLGRLDGGSLDQWACGMAEAVGYDLDAEEMSRS